MIDYSLLPVSVQDGARRYIENGIEPGDFLRAVLSNDFAEAVVRADSGNSLVLRSFAHFLYSCPSECWGSEERVRSWISAGGLAGKSKGENENEEA